MIHRVNYLSKITPTPQKEKFYSNGHIMRVFTNYTIMYQLIKKLQHFP